MTDKLPTKMPSYYRDAFDDLYAQEREELIAREKLVPRRMKVPVPKSLGEWERYAARAFRAANGALKGA